MQTTEENGAAAPVMTGARILIEALHAEGVEYPVECECHPSGRDYRPDAAEE